MQRSHTGRPGTVVIPDGWATAGAAVVDGTHPSSVTIGPAGGPAVYNPTSNQTETAAVAPVYVGRATLMLLQTRADRAEQVVDDPTASRKYDVTLPYVASAGVQVGHVVTVAAGDPDPMLSTKHLRVEAVERGSRRFSRVLIAILID